MRLAARLRMKLARGDTPPLAESRGRLHDVIRYHVGPVGKLETLGFSASRVRTAEPEEVDRGLQQRATHESLGAMPPKELLPRHRRARENSFDLSP